MTPVLRILGTGGTISATAASPARALGYRPGDIAVQDLLHAVPGLPQPLEARQVAQIDSKDADWPFWRTLLAACAQAMEDGGVRALLVTHGTDTMEESAWFLHHALHHAGRLRKPLVLTCAMRPAGSLLGDGAQNLFDAATVALDEATPAGVWVVAAGEVHSGLRVQKVHPYRLHALESPESGPAALVQDGRVRWLHALPPGPPAQRSAAALQDLLALEQLPWVETVCSGALARMEGVDALVQAGVRGLLVAGSGNATVHKALLPALGRARERGVWVWRSTRCAQGLPVAPGGDDADAAGTLVPLPPARARIALMLALAGWPHP